MLKAARGTSGPLHMHFSVSFASCINQGAQRLKQLLSIIFSSFLLPSAPTSAQKLVVICMLCCSCHGSHLLHPAPGPEKAARTISLSSHLDISFAAQGPRGASNIPKADFITEQSGCSCVLLAGLSLQNLDWRFIALSRDTLHMLQNC